MDLAPTRRVYLSGRDLGTVLSIPKIALGVAIARPFWHLLGRLDVSGGTALGGRFQKYGKSGGTSFIRLEGADLERLGIVRVPRR